MWRRSSSTSSSSCSLGSTSFTSSCRRFLSKTCDCGGRTPIVPEDPLDPAEAESLEFTEEELEGPLVRLPVAPVEFILLKLDMFPQLEKLTLFWIKTQ